MARPDQIRLIIWNAKHEIIQAKVRKDALDEAYQRGRRDAAHEILRMED